MCVDTMGGCSVELQCLARSIQAVVDSDNESNPEACQCNQDRFTPKLFYARRKFCNIASASSVVVQANLSSQKRAKTMESSNYAAFKQVET